MLRALSLFGMGGLFLTISPKLRGSLAGGIESFTGQMDNYSPWSYIGGVIVILLVLMYSMYRGAQAR
jgi:hypothetical protein